MLPKEQEDAINATATDMEAITTDIRLLLIFRNILAVDEFFTIGADNDLIAGSFRESFHAAHDTRFDIVLIGNIDDAGSNGFITVELDSMTAVKYLIHLFHRDLTGLVDRLEYRWEREKIILDDADILTKVTALRLSAACAVDDTGNRGTVLIKNITDNRQECSRR